MPPSMSIGDCCRVGLGIDSGKPPAMGGEENIIGGGGMREAGDLSVVFMLQLVPSIGEVLGQIPRGSSTLLGNEEASQTVSTGILRSLSSHTENLRRAPDDARPSKGAMAR